MSDTKPTVLNGRGSDHYKGTIEPAQYIHANQLSFFEGNVLKYVTRHRRAGNASDIKKALHYLAMILEMDYGIVTTWEFSDSSRKG